jgi:Family of unknown function (DUF5675)
VKLHLRRKWLTEASTVGELYVDGEFQCFILEDRYRPAPEVKVPGATCIPPGTYPVRITHSPRFNRDLPLVCDVPGFTGVRIHPGNTAADTEGCLLPGRVRHGDAVAESRAAFVELFALLQGAEEISLEITVEPVIEL